MLFAKDSQDEWIPVQRIFESLKDAEVIKRALEEDGTEYQIFYRKITDWEIW